MSQPVRLTFIVALRDADDAAGLARLLDDVQLPRRSAAFMAPAVRGSQLLSTDGGLPGAFSPVIPPGGEIVYLLDHEPGLPELLRRVTGPVYVGIPRPAVAAEYPGHVRTFVSGGPLDFATVVMRDYSRPASGREVVFDEGEALRMAALASDFPVDLDDDLEVSPPVVDSVMVGSERFYGRTQEQRTFRQLLRDMIATPPESAAQVSTSHVCLVYGIGGMGKTTLCARFQDIAHDEDEFRARVRVVALNWDDQKAAAEGLKARAETGDTPIGLLSLIAEAFGDSAQRYFRSFHKLIGQIREAEGRAARQLRSGDEDSSVLSSIGVTGAKLLATATLPPPLAATINVAADQLPALTSKARAWLDRVRPEDRKLMLEGDRLLADAFATDIRAASRERPIMIALDTYELISWAEEHWLRPVYEKTSPRVAWILAGRFTDKQRRYYSAHWQPGERFIPLPLGQLNEHEMAAYFNDKAAGRPVDPETNELLYRTTGGVPLAVYLAAKMWQGGVSLELITGQGDTGDLLDDELVEDMLERFLKYAREDPTRPDDYDRLCMLALLPDRLEKPEDEDADLLAVLWGVERVSPVLDELEARYEFVSRRMRLHDKVRETLRRHMMNAATRHDLRARNRPAIGYLEDRLGQWQSELATLEARCQDEEWKKDVLALSWHRFWDSYEVGWATVVSALPAAIAFDREFGSALLDQASRFALDAAQRHGLEAIRQSLDAYSYLTTRTSEQALAELSRRQRRPGVQPDDDCLDERTAILTWQKALNLIEGGNLSEALRCFETVVDRLPAASIVLREKLTRDLEREAYFLVWSDTDRWYQPSEQGLEMARLATTLTPGDSQSWSTYGMALWATHHHDAAIKAYTTATELDPGSETCNALGSALLRMGRYEEALRAFDRAIEYEGSARNLNNRGFVLHWCGRDKEALLAFDQAIATDPEYAIAYSNLAATWLDLGELDRAETAALKAAQLDPERASAWLIAGVIALYLDHADAASERFAAVLNLRHNAPSRSVFSRDMLTAIALSCTGRGDEAVGLLRDVSRERLPSDTSPLGILKLLDRCHAELGRLDEVRALIAGPVEA